MVMNTPDFSAHEIVIKLPMPFYFQPARAEEVVVTHVQLRRLMAANTTRFKHILRSMESNVRGYLQGANEFLILSCAEFYAADGAAVQNAASHVVLGRMRMENLFKTLTFSAMLQRGTSLVSSTAYEHRSRHCGKTTVFDIDPDSPPPAKPERGRMGMQDFMQFYSERCSDSPIRDYTYSFRRPIQLVDLQGNPFELFRITYEGPAFESYLAAVSDNKKIDAFDLWSVFDSITSFNDLSPEETKKLKIKNGFDAIFEAIDPEESAAITAPFDAFGSDVVMTDKCGWCSGALDTDFDYSNFFDFQRKTASGQKQNFAPV